MRLHCSCIWSLIEAGKTIVVPSVHGQAFSVLKIGMKTEALAMADGECLQIPLIRTLKAL